MSQFSDGDRTARSIPRQGRVRCDTDLWPGHWARRGLHSDWSEPCRASTVRFISCELAHGDIICNREWIISRYVSIHAEINTVGIDILVLLLYFHFHSHLPPFPFFPQLPGFFPPSLFFPSPRQQASLVALLALPAGWSEYCATGIWTGRSGEYGKGQLPALTVSVRRVITWLEGE